MQLAHGDGVARILRKQRLHEFADVAAGARCPGVGDPVGERLWIAFRSGDPPTRLEEISAIAFGRRQPARGDARPGIGLELVLQSFREEELSVLDETLDLQRISDAEERERRNDDRENRQKDSRDDVTPRFERRPGETLLHNCQVQVVPK